MEKGGEAVRQDRGNDGALIFVKEAFCGGRGEGGKPKKRDKTTPKGPPGQAGGGGEINRRPGEKRGEKLSHTLGENWCPFETESLAPSASKKGDFSESEPEKRKADPLEGPNEKSAVGRKKGVIPHQILFVKKVWALSGKIPVMRGPPEERILPEKEGHGFSKKTLNWGPFLKKWEEKKTYVPS